MLTFLVSQLSDIFGYMITPSYGVAVALCGDADLFRSLWACYHEIPNLILDLY